MERETHPDIPHVRRVNARPLNDRVLVKVFEPQTGTLEPHSPFVVLSGLQALTTGAKPPAEPPAPELQPARGVIVSVGPGYVVNTPESRHYVALDLSIGDEVLFFEERGLKLRINDEELYLVNEQSILIVLDSLDGEPAVVLDP